MSKSLQLINLNKFFVGSFAKSILAVSLIVFLSINFSGCALLKQIQGTVESEQVKAELGKASKTKQKLASSAKAIRAARMDRASLGKVGGKKPAAELEAIAKELSRLEKTTGLKTEGVAAETVVVAGAQGKVSPFDSVKEKASGAFASLFNLGKSRASGKGNVREKSSEELALAKIGKAEKAPYRKLGAVQSKVAGKISDSTDVAEQVADQVETGIDKKLATTEDASANVSDDAASLGDVDPDELDNARAMLADPEQSGDATGVGAIDASTMAAVGIDGATEAEQAKIPVWVFLLMAASLSIAGFGLLWVSRNS